MTQDSWDSTVMTPEIVAVNLFNAVVGMNLRYATAFVKTHVTPLAYDAGMWYFYVKYHGHVYNFRLDYNLYGIRRRNLIRIRTIQDLYRYITEGPESLHLVKY